MDHPKELHKQTVKLLNTIKRTKDSDMGLASKKVQTKKLVKQLLDLWVDYKDKTSASSIPSKEVVMAIAEEYDNRYLTSYKTTLFSKDDEAMSYADFTECASDQWSDCMSDDFSIMTL